MDKKKCTEDWLYQLGQILFYIGLVLELLIVIADKSAYINPWEGQLFRITFLLFLGKICLTRYSFREWLWMLFFLIIAGTCYLFSGRDEAVRLVVFCASFKNVDLRKSLQLAFRHTVGLPASCIAGFNRYFRPDVYCGCRGQGNKVYLRAGAS